MWQIRIGTVLQQKFDESSIFGSTCVAEEGRRRPAADVSRCSKVCAISADLLSLDHLVGDGKQLIWNIQIKRFCGLPIDHELEFRRLLNRQFTRARPLEDFVHIEGCLTVQIRETRAERDEATGIDESLGAVHGRDPVGAPSTNRGYPPRQGQSATRGRRSPSIARNKLGPDRGGVGHLPSIGVGTIYLSDQPTSDPLVWPAGYRV